MKINAKLFILVFTIITCVSVASAFIYHTLAQQLLKSQQSKALVNSANDFIFAFQELIVLVDEEFQIKYNMSDKLSLGNNLDFIFEVQNDSNIISSRFILKNDAKVYKDVSSLKEFLHYNTNILLRNITKSKKSIYYGIVINAEIIKKLSEKIRAEIALVEGNVVTKFTNKNENQYYLPHLSRVSRELKNKNNFELVHETISDVDFSATNYSPRLSLIDSNDVEFIIFNISKEAATFKTTMNLVTLIHCDFWNIAHSGFPIPLYNQI